MYIEKITLTRIVVFSLLLMGLFLVACGGVPAPTPAATPPPAPPAATGDAASIYQQNCSACHGVNREGMVGPSLKAADIQARGRDDQYLKDTIANGRNAMPPWKDKLSPSQIDSLIKLLRS